MRVGHLANRLGVLIVAVWTYGAVPGWAGDGESVGSVQDLLGLPNGNTGLCHVLAISPCPQRWPHTLISSTIEEKRSSRVYCSSATSSKSWSRIRGLRAFSIRAWVMTGMVSPWVNRSKTSLWIIAARDRLKGAIWGPVLLDKWMG